MVCPNCGKEIIFKENEHTAACESCGCVLTISVTAKMPEDVPLKEGLSQTGEGKEGRFESACAKPSDASLAAKNADSKNADSEDKPAKKQLNVFGPAAVVLGALTVLFAFLAGIKALVFGIPALVVGALGLLACYLLKNVKKRLSVSGLILSAAGIIIAVIIRTGFVF